MRLRAYALALSLIGASAAAQPQAQPDPETRRIAFLLPALDAATRAQLREALLAQSAMLGAEIVLLEEAPDAQDAPLRERVETARAAARDQAAAIALWLETSTEGAWLVHVLDMEQERAVVRRIETRDTARSAAIEAVAVLTREASRSVFARREQQPEPVEPVPSEPAKEPEPARAPATPAPVVAPVAPSAPEPARGLRLSLAYQGSDFAPQTSFAHGLAVGARVAVWQRFYAGLGLAWQTPEQPVNTGLSVQRIPLLAQGGVRVTPSPVFELDLELCLTLEILQRTTNIVPSPTVEVSSDRTRVIASLGPRLRGELKPWTFMGLFVGVGVDLVLTRFAYEGELAAGNRTVFLQPDWIQPEVEAGIAVYP